MIRDMVPRKVIHVDMDAFYASVEQRDDESLRGRPVVVAWEGPRSVVCAASYEARRFGLHSAMSALRAAALCPQAVFVPPDFARYRAVSQHVRAIFGRHTDLVEPLSLDEAYLDVTLNKRGLASATEVAEMIRREIREETGLTASAGVAPNKFLAKIASDWNKPDGLFVIRPRDVDAFMLQLPVGKIPGVGRVTRQRLSELGIETAGDVRQHERMALEKLFGRFGGKLLDRAHGLDLRPVEPAQVVQQVSVEETFERDLGLDALQVPLRRMCDKLWSQAVRKGLFGRTVVLKLKTARFRVLTRSQSFTGTPDSGERLYLAIEQLLRRVEQPPRTLYRLAGVGMSSFQEPGAVTRQMSLFDQ